MRATDNEGHIVNANEDTLISAPLILQATLDEGIAPQPRITYRVKNTGASLAEDVEMTVTIPEGTTFVLSTRDVIAGPGWKWGRLTLFVVEPRPRTCNQNSPS